MAKSKKPRKPYRSLFKEAGGPIVPSLFRGAPDQGLKLKLIPHQALCALKEGTAEEWGVNVLALRLNVTYLLLCRHFDNPDEVQTLREALQAMRAILTRPADEPPTQHEAGLIGWALCVGDDVQDLTTRKEQGRAMTVAARVAGIDLRSSPLRI